MFEIDAGSDEELMRSHKEAIRQIFVSHLTELALGLERDTKKNYRQKAHNFLLSGMAPERVLEMVFTSSFESKTGNMMEKCAFQIARLRYGKQATPEVIKGLGATDADVRDYIAATLPGKTKKTSQVVLTRTNPKKVGQHARTIIDANAKAKTNANIGVTQSILLNRLLRK